MTLKVTDNQNGQLS